MEFPDLGAHCSWAACQRLDFLPLKCDACERIFCTDHVAYAQHECTSAYKKDVQVPVCPLCNTPVPVRRGEMPDVVVGEHIDRDCRSDPAQRQRKIFTNKCLKPGCKQKEMMKVICEQCHKNYCLKHRHPLDHDCAGAGRPLSKAGHAALARAQVSPHQAGSTSSSTARPAGSPPRPAPPRGVGSATTQVRSTSSPAAVLQNGLSEEEALQRALEMSLAESAHGSAQPPRYSWFAWLGGDAAHSTGLHMMALLCKVLGKGKSTGLRLSPLLGGDSARQCRGDTLLPDCLALMSTARAAGGSWQPMGTLLGAAKWSAGVKAAPCPLLPRQDRGVDTWGAGHTVRHCPRSTQEEEDLALAQALSASEAEYQQLQRQGHGSKPSNCSMS